MVAIKSNLSGVSFGHLEREGMVRKIERMVDVWDMTAVAQCRIKVSEADTKERVRYLWEIVERIGMEPVDANPGEIFLRKVPSARQLCALIDKSEPEGFRIVSCVRL
ncbi:hypothetical protein VDG1235_4708 [Verrucomicrobiia bacterium DG1235]|nr:hypothetical protein VDG1235_4708 [Verrucomicrobiae bacterium DG1235]